MTPNLLQAVAQTRIDEFVRAADRRRYARLRLRSA
jgi:hypothetical protein